MKTKIFNKISNQRKSQLLNKSTEIADRKIRQNSLRFPNKNFKTFERQRGSSEGVKISVLKEKRNEFKIVCNLVNEEDNGQGFEK